MMRDADLQISAAGDACRVLSGARGAPGVLQQVLASRAFTLPQLFACLVVKEHQRKTYRDVEALLRDASHWCRAIGMRKVPDHNTLCRAFHTLNLRGRRGDAMLDRLTQWFAIARQ